MIFGSEVLETIKVLNRYFNEMLDVKRDKTP